MINSIMSVILLLTGEDSTKIDTPQNIKANSEIQFEQILSILMAQIGMFAMAPQPNLNNIKEVSTNEENMEIQPTGDNDSSQTVVPKNLCVDSSVASVKETETPQIVGAEQHLLAEQQSIINEISNSECDTDTKLMGNETIQNSNPVNVEELQDELILKLDSEVIEFQVEFVEEQSKSTSTAPNNVKPVIEEKNISAQQNDSIISVKTSDNAITTNVNKSEESNNTDINMLQGKLQIKNIELSDSPTLSQESVKQKEPQSNINIQTEKLIYHTNQQQSTDNIPSTKGQPRLENVLINKTKEGLFIENAVSKFGLDLENQDALHPKYKVDILRATDPSLIASSVKSTKEIPCNKLSEVHPILPLEPQPVVSSLSSLKSVITEQIKFTMKSGLKTVRIKLEPESLGILEIKVQEQSGKIGIQLSTSNNEVQKVLVQSLPQLWETLKHEGIFTKDVQVVSTGTMNLMLNQEPYSHQFTQETHSEPTTYFMPKELEQNKNETKPLSRYHDGTLNLWI